MRLGLFVTTFLLLFGQPCHATSALARVAVLGMTTPSDPASAPYWQVFIKTLRALGWTEGKNLTLIRRWSEGSQERAAALAEELVAAQPDVIVAQGYPNTRAASQATKTIPIVFIDLPDPIGGGFVANLARPGGNITGTSDQAEDVVAKGLQLLKETRPGISRFAVLSYGDPAYWENAVRNYNLAARPLGLALAMVPVTSSDDFDSAFGRIAHDRPDALVVSSIPLFAEHTRQIASFAIERRLPSFTFSAAMARDGLLLGHSPEFLDMFRPAAVIVDKILKGAKPADIPVEQPTHFHFVVNLETARAIGLDLPTNLVARADEVIE